MLYNLKSLALINILTELQETIRYQNTFVIVAGIIGAILISLQIVIRPVIHTKWFVSPPNRKKHVEEYTKYKEDVEIMLLKNENSPSHIAFKKALIECMIVMLALPVLFDELVKVCNEIEQLENYRYPIIGRASGIGVIRLCFNGMGARRAEIRGELKRLTKSVWNPNKKIAKGMSREINIDALDDIFLVTYNSLTDGEKQIGAIEQWYKSALEKLASADRQQALRDLSVVAKATAIVAVASIAISATQSNQNVRYIWLPPLDN